jgi:hypothetical protein
MLPEAQHDRILGSRADSIVFEELLSKNTGLREVVYPFFNFDVGESISSGIVGKVVNSCELLGEVIDIHAHEFQSCHGHHEVKILEVDGAVARNFGGDNTVEMKLDGDHVDCGHATVPRVVYSVATNGETCAIGVILFGAKIYTDAHIHYIFEAVGGDLFT